MITNQNLRLARIRKKSNIPFVDQHDKVSKTATKKCQVS